MPKPWYFSSARPFGAEMPFSETAQWGKGETAVQVVTRVRVNPRLRRAEARKLFKQEEGDKRLCFSFTATSLRDDGTTYAQAALLVAAARMVRRLGSARRRGRGECRLSVDSVEGWYDSLPAGSTWQSHLLENFKKVWINNDKGVQIQIPSPQWAMPQSGTNEAKRYCVIVRIDEPVVVAKRAETGNLFEGTNVISGTTLLGALAQEAAKRWDLSDKTIYENFLNIFRRGHVRFFPFYPAYVDQTMIYPTIPAPIDLLVCKIYNTPDPAHNKIKSYASQENLSESSECSTCCSNVPLVSLQGFLAVRDGTAPVRSIPFREEMHPCINPHTQRVATGNLFVYIGLDTGVYYMGEIWCKDDTTWQILRQLTGIVENEPFHLRLGKGIRRGYGLVTAWLEPITGIDLWRGKPIEERVTNLSDPITLTLLTDAIVPDVWGRFKQSFDELLIKEWIGTDIEVIRVFCKAGFVDGFNNHLGLPRWRDVALKAGSAVGFKLRNSNSTDLVTFRNQLKKLEEEGIGVRRHEGFGQVVFNHPVYQCGKGISSVRFIPNALRLASGLHANSTTEIIKADFDFIREWVRKLRDPNQFTETNFQKEKWGAVARWLHTAAHLPVDQLIAELDSFGNAKILTTVGREEKQHFTTEDAKQAMEHLKHWLKNVRDLSVPLRKLAIQLLANHIAGSVERKGR